jgi:CubicO group peptidase (beta-lactamase class C family)
MPIRRVPALPVILALLAIASFRTATASPPADTFPGASWARIGDPAAAGFSPSKLDALRETLRGSQTTGLLIVAGGEVLFEYGDVAETSYVASARKSVVAMLYGKYVENKVVRLDATLGSLGIDDTEGLLPIERSATVADLLAARSGVYHPAANLGDASALAPPRGSVQPGRYFLYNNWDFNALGAILERQTGRSLYDLFTDDLAMPLGLEDWDATPGAYAAAVRNDTGLSKHPAHHFVLSTRDMARLGYLMLRHGQWRGRSVMSSRWVARISSIVTPADEVARTSPFIAGLGYGNLWWVFDPARWAGSPLEAAFTASGAFGQYITVVPRLDLVIAHKTVVPPPRNVPNDTYFGVILPRAIDVR